MVSSDRSRVLVSLCVLTAAVAVTGKPHARCSSHDDYAAALSAAHYLPAPHYLPVAFAPTAFSQPPSSRVEYAGEEEAASFRSGRSNGPADAAAQDDVAPPPSPPPARHPVKLTAATLGPCIGGPSPAQVANDTASLTAEKLTAYYDQLKAQQELMARHQIEMQLMEQQQHRQREYALVQQQIQQQYYQQQQHAMAMLDQLHRNPAFVSQMATYMEQRLKANNGTAVAKTLVPDTTVPDTAVPDVAAAAAAAAVTKAGRDDVGHGARSHSDVSDHDDDQDEKNEKDEKDENDEKADRGCGVVSPAKRAERRQIAGRDRAGRSFARDASARTDDLADDHRRRSEEKVDSVFSE